MNKRGKSVAHRKATDFYVSNISIIGNYLKRCN